MRHIDLLKTEETHKGILYGNSDTLKHNSHAINRNVWFHWEARDYSRWLQCTSERQVEVTDDTRIRAAIPTIKKVLEKGGSVILMSHLGRPKKGPEDKFSLKHIISAVEKRLGVKVDFAPDCQGQEAADKAAALKPGQVLLLENLRFYAEEEGKPRGLKEDATDEEKAAAKRLSKLLKKSS